MKTIASILLVTGAVIAYVVVQITAKPGPVNELIVMQDMTAPHLSKPGAEDILPLYGFEEEKYSGGVFRFTVLTDVSANRTYEAEIKSENEWLSNEYDREEKIQGFYSEIRNILSGIGKESVGKNYSSIYTPLADGLNKLSESKAKKRILLIYSDLMENTGDISFYNENTLRRIKSGDGGIRKYLEDKTPISDLKGVTAYLIYQPADPEEDRLYRIVSGFYKDILEQKGARVVITANLIN